jgi:hypothetical protein
LDRQKKKGVLVQSSQLVNATDKIGKPQTHERIHHAEYDKETGAYIGLPEAWAELFDMPIRRKPEPAKQDTSEMDFDEGETQVSKEPTKRMFILEKSSMEGFMFVLKIEGKSEEYHI